MTEASYFKWVDLPQTAMTPQIGRRIVSGEKFMVVELTLAKGAIVGTHSHPHEQMTHVVSGRLEFDVQGKKRVLGQDEVAHLPPNVPHGAVALEDSVTLEVFSPPREDFLTGEKANYMK